MAALPDARLILASYGSRGSEGRAGENRDFTESTISQTYLAIQSFTRARCMNTPQDTLMQLPPPTGCSRPEKPANSIKTKDQV